MSDVFYALSQLFELRKTTPLFPRKAVGRLFFLENKWGVCDATGILWPLCWEGDLKYHGAAIVFESSFFQNHEQSYLRYLDDGYYLKIDHILHETLLKEDWPNSVISHPLPSSLTEKACGTQFFEGDTQKRASLIKLRNRALKSVREFFDYRLFDAMETPSLVPSGGVEAYVSSFHTEYVDHRGKKHLLRMPTSPEFALKKLLAEGYSKIYQLSRSFRNGGELSFWHEPEFIMLEWYRTGESLSCIMNETRELVEYLRTIIGSVFDFPKKWKTYTVEYLFSHCAHLDLKSLQKEDDFREAVKNRGIYISPSDDWDACFCKVFLERIEPFLKEEKACFVRYYPVQMGALAERSSKSPLFVDRFEAYLNGIEICNGYQELTCTQELFERFSHIESQRGTEVSRDEIFEKTMQFGLPRCTGNAMGIDRVIALLLGVHLSDIYAIPFLSQFVKDKVSEN